MSNELALSIIVAGMIIAASGGFATVCATSVRVAPLWLQKFSLTLLLLGAVVVMAGVFYIDTRS